MAKRMVRLIKNVVSNIESWPDNTPESKDLMEPGERQVIIGDVYENGLFFRDGVQILTPLEKAKSRIAELEVSQPMVDLINELGGIRDEWMQSDRLGFDWHNYYINNQLYRQDYVPQAEPHSGSSENPFLWDANLLLIPNGYYVNNDVRKVWTGDRGVCADWNDSGFVEF